MKRLVLFTLLLHATIILAQQFSPKRELRAVWIASVSNIDWPSSKTLTTTQQRNEFISILDKHQQNGMNAVFVQIRPSCDAFYAYAKEPWSEWLTGSQGVGPQPFYDPLDFMIKETHKRGMEFHAWFNPYRSVVSGSSSVHDSHISKTKPEWNLRFSTPYKLLDPGIPDVRNYVTSVILDVVRRYDIDGVHFDDYFYPYEGITTQDSASWRLYKGSFTDIGDWRRNNVNTLIKMIYDSIQVIKPWVKFGISPFGIWKSGTPPGITGLSAYSEIYCDALAWLNAKTVDYITPQLYWVIGGPQDYSILMPWWYQQAVLFNGRHLYTGNAVYRLSSSSGNWPASEIAEQIRLNRLGQRAQGSLFFSSKSVTNNLKGIQDTLRNILYKYKALVPTMPWKDSIPPLPPTNLIASGQPTRIILQWEKPAPASDGDTARYFVIYRAVAPDTININDPRQIRYITPNDTTSFTDIFLVPYNVPHTYVVTTMDKLHNESEATASVTYTLVGVEPIVASRFDFKLEQNYPNPFNSISKIKYEIASNEKVSLKVFDVLGREVATLVDEEKSPGNYEVEWSANEMPSGVYVYQLRAGSFIDTKKMIITK